MAIRAFSATVGLFLATCILAGGGTAHADDPIPPLPLPSEITSQPGFVGPGDDPATASSAKKPARATASQATDPAGGVSPPSQQQVDDARAALDRLRKGDKSKHTRITQVAGPTGGDTGGSVASRISDQAWWTLLAGLLVLVVASETTRLQVRRAKHRKDA